MKEKDILNELERLAAQLSVTIKYVKLNAKGGLCRVYGKYFIYVDTKITLNAKISILTNSLKNFNISDIYLSPALRLFLKEYEAS
mgnify:CR=1 FL=1|jgi:hypothetical protein